MTQILPDCMMPDGAEPCVGYQQLNEAKATSRRRLNTGELMALRVILASVETQIRAALTAEGASDRRDALKIAQAQLNTALEITKD